MKELLNRLRAAFANLSDQERLLVTCAGLALLIAIAYAAVLRPTLAAGDRASERAMTAETQLEAVRRLRKQFDDVHHRLTAVEQRIQKGTRGNLRTTLESLATEANVKVESMEPQASPANDRYRETKVEVGLKGVTLPQTVTYLHKIESAQQVLSVKSLRVRTRADKPELLDVTFTVSSFEPI